MDNIEEQVDIVYGPHPATKKEKNRIYQADFRERNREKLREKKRFYDARTKQAIAAYKEILKTQQQQKENETNGIK